MTRNASASVQENRDVGSSDSSGRLLVPDLRSFDPITLPSSRPISRWTARLTSPRTEVRPQDRSGVVVRFRVKVSHGALLRLVDEAGVPLPIGSTAKLRSSGSTVPV